MELKKLDMFVKRIKKFSDARWNSGEKCWTIKDYVVR